MSENEAVIKIIKQHTKDLSELNARYVKLGKQLLFCRKRCAEVLDEKTNVDAICTTLRRKNKELNAIVVRFERENERLQESLDGAQREIDKLNEKIETLYDCGDDLRNFNLVEGEGG